MFVFCKCVKGRYIKLRRGITGLINVGTDGESSRIYRLEMLQAKLSYGYNKINTVFDYCALGVYIKAFIKTALGGDMPLKSNSDG
jgi:hypothetical protein